MNQEEQITTALRMTITNLSDQLAEKTVSNNLLAIQLSEAQQIIEKLQIEKEEMLQQLEEATKPEKITEGE